MKVIITGSRDWEGVGAVNRIHDVLDNLLLFCESLGERLHLIHGDCPTGADAIADTWAKAINQAHGQKVLVEPCPANWKQLGRAAGPRRNQEMLEKKPDMVIGFRRNNSAGTGQMLAIARNADVFAVEIPWPGSVPPAEPNRYEYARQQRKRRASEPSA